MRRWAVYALELALVMGLAVTARAAEPADDAPPATPQGSGNLFTRWFGFAPPTLGKKAAAKTSKEEALPPSKTAVRDAAAGQRAREEAALLRRQAVCLKLRTIAIQTNDEDLRKKADQLDEQAWNTYIQRTAHLPAGGAGEALGEATLERHLGSGTEHADASPVRGSRGVNGHAAAGEELP